MPWFWRIEGILIAMTGTIPIVGLWCLNLNPSRVSIQVGLEVLHPKDQFPNVRRGLTLGRRRGDELWRLRGERSRNEKLRGV